MGSGVLACPVCAVKLRDVISEGPRVRAAARHSAGADTEVFFRPRGAVPVGDSIGGADPYIGWAARPDSPRKCLVEPCGDRVPSDAVVVKDGLVTDDPDVLG